MPDEEDAAFQAPYQFGIFKGQLHLGCSKPDYEGAVCGAAGRLFLLPKTELGVTTSLERWIMIRS